MKILIIGLPGSGKTTFSKKLYEELEKRNILVARYNGDEVREYYKDWDFSSAGRLRQLDRMVENAELCERNGIVSICDFICPYELFRDYFDANITIWMDTIKESKYEDTNKVFEEPSKYDYRITSFQQIDNFDFFPIAQLVE